jgi:hypothetical protein
VTSNDSTVLGLETADGWTASIDTTGVVLTRDGTTIAPSDILVGQPVRVVQTRNADGSYTVTGIEVQPRSSAASSVPYPAAASRSSSRVAQRRRSPSTRRPRGRRQVRRSFRTLIDELATLTRNRAAPARVPDETAFEITAIPTPLQARALSLLNLSVSSV